VVKLSRPFSFEHKRVEYCIGIEFVESKQVLTAFYTIFDTDCSFLSIDLKTVDWINMQAI
jgi:DNA-directed RNA polymerase delta subunit